MDADSHHQTVRSGGATVAGIILLAIAIVLELVGLSMALEDPCSGVSGCQPLVDMRPAGWTVAIFALMVGLPAAWMVYWGSRLTGE